MKGEDYESVLVIPYNSRIIYLWIYNCGTFGCGKGLII